MIADRRCWGIADDGSAIEVRTDRDDDAALDIRWPPMGLRRSPDPGERVVRLVHAHTDPTSGEVHARVDGEPSPGGWDRVESELALFAAERLTGLVAVHAAVVVGEQFALMVPGASGAGKSTLCVAAAEIGARVLTDEYALVDPATGLVTGWRRPVKIRQANGPSQRLELTVDCGPVAVGLVAIVLHDPAGITSWATMTASEATLGLLANTVCARSRPDESLDAALAIARRAPAVAGTRGEAAQVIVELLEMADRGGTATPPEAP